MLLYRSHYGRLSESAIYLVFGGAEGSITVVGFFPRYHPVDHSFKRFVCLAGADLVGSLDEPLKPRLLVGWWWFACWHKESPATLVTNPLLSVVAIVFVFYRYDI
jgi:hypothetical protein